MMKYLFPRLKLYELRVVIWYSLIGSMLAGFYGILHDQVTYSIGPEYFRNFKFHQFAYANLNLGERVFAGTIGFLATWWARAFTGWILARRAVATLSPADAHREIMKGFAIVLTSAVVFAIGGYCYGKWRGPNADYSYWQQTFEYYGVSDFYPFICVGYIHNAGYIGGLLGLILTFLLIRPQTQVYERSTPSTNNILSS